MCASARTLCVCVCVCVFFFFLLDKECPCAICVQGGLVYVNCKCMTSRLTNSGIPEIPIAVNEVSFMTLNLESGVQ